MHFHWHNDSTIQGRKGVATRKRFPFNGRAWLSWSNSNRGLNFEWNILNKHAGIGLKFGGEETIGFNIQIPYIVGLYFNANLFNLMSEERELSLRFHGGTMWWHIWIDGWGDRPQLRYGSLARKIRAGNFNPVDFFFGRTKCEKQLIEEQKDISVPMPEKAYPASAKLVEYSWKRPRSLFTKRILRCEIEVPEGIPFEGKGENSWDCGPDRSFSMTTGEVRSIADGVAKFVGSVLNDRIKYGGWSDWNWTKDKKE